MREAPRVIDGGAPAGTASRVEAWYRSGEVARSYWSRHCGSRLSRLYNGVETRLAARALKEVDSVSSILDCPAGVGRFWPVLARDGARLHAVDTSREMLGEGLRRHPEIDLAEVRTAAAEALPYADGAVDLVFSNRLLHHFSESEPRRAILREFARVSRRYVVFSLFETGNFKAWRKAAIARAPRPHRRVFLDPETVLADVEASGLVTRRVLHKLRWYSPLALYVTEVR